MTKEACESLGSFGSNKFTILTRAHVDGVLPGWAAGDGGGCGTASRTISRGVKFSLRNRMRPFDAAYDIQRWPRVCRIAGGYGRRRGWDG